MTAQSAISSEPWLNRPKPLVSHVVLATCIFVLTEVMFFTALISAYLVIRAGQMRGWAPPNGITLPVVATGLNTFILLCSGYLMIRAVRSFKISQHKEKTYVLLLWTWLLGALFLVFQGWEWIKLIDYGMDLASGGLFGACFYLLVTAHALHVLGAVAVLGWALVQQKKLVLRQDQLNALAIYWTFVVVLWPILYGLVYF